MENNTNLYNPNTGKLLEAGQTVYDQNTGNKIIQGSPFSLPRNINTVGADQINDQRNITTPDMQPALYNSDLAGTVNGLVVGSKTQSATDLADQTRRDDLATSRQDINSKFGSLLDVNTELGAVSSNIDRTAENNARKQVDQYTSDIEQMQRESDKRIKNFVQTFGGTTAGANAEALKMQREDLSAQADKALLLSAATRNYSTLNAIAEQQVINKTAELKAKSDNLKAYIEMNKADFDKKEQRLYDEEQKKVDADLQKQTDIENSIKDIKIQAAKGGADSSIINKLSNVDTKNKKAFDEALALATPFLGTNSIVKLDNGNTVMVNAQGKVISSLGGAKPKASENNNFAFSNDMIKNNFGNDIVGTIASVINKSEAKKDQSTNDAINVIAGLQTLVRDNPDGVFPGLAPIRLLPGRLKSPEAITNLSNIEAVNLKVQQWASGAALTDKQTEQVEKITPRKGDTDKQVKTKTNALANYMISQVSGQLAGQGIGFSMDNVDMFTKTPEQELLELYKNPTTKTQIEQVIKLYPNATDAEVLQIIKP